MTSDLNENDFFTIYNKIYHEYQSLSDEELIAKWKIHQHQSKHINDIDCIGIAVCEDLLRQRGNTYLDDTYPRD